MAAKKSNPTQPASPSSGATSSSDESHKSSSVAGSDSSSDRASSAAPSAGESSDTVVAAQQPQQEPTDFDSWYLRQMTAEFGDDLDKVRNANDFTHASLPILIQALKECSSVYSPEQKRKAMGLSPGEGEGTD